MKHTDHLEVVDSMGHGDYLKVLVRDTRDGNHYQVDFLANLQGQYKYDGGGGYKPSRHELFSAAKSVAGQYVTDQLGYEVIPKVEWNRVPISTAVGIVEESDEYEVRLVESVGEDADGGEV